MRKCEFSREKFVLLDRLNAKYPNESFEITWKEVSRNWKDAWAHMPKRSREEFIYSVEYGELHCDYAGEGEIVAKWDPKSRKWV
jgi:hypothetical protein